MATNNAMIEVLEKARANQECYNRWWFGKNGQAYLVTALWRLNPPTYYVHTMNKAFETDEAAQAALEAHIGCDIEAETVAPYDEYRPVIASPDEL